MLLASPGCSMNVETLSPVSVLRRELERRSTRNPCYSLRAFARDVGLSHTYLSLVLHGKRQLSLNQGYRLAGLLNLTDLDTEAFVLESKQALERRTKQMGVRKAELLQNDKFQYVSHWYHIAILDLTLVEGFQSNIEWIAEKLKITPSQAGRAVARLERLGLLKNENGQWKKSAEDLVVPGTESSRAIRRFHTQMIRRGLSLLDNGGKEPLEKRDITGTTMAIDPTLLPEAKKRIQRFRRDLMRLLSTGERTSLYQLNVQLFSLCE